MVRPLKSQPENLSDPALIEIAALRERLDLIWSQHEREHSQHEAAHAREHGFSQQAIETAATLAKENKADANEWRASMNDREAKFATKTDIGNLTTGIETLKIVITERLDKIERASLVRDERERLAAAEQTKDRTDSDRKISRNQWVAGVIITFVVILVNLVISLLTT